MPTTDKEQRRLRDSEIVTCNLLISQSLNLYKTKL
jgi:hypothetical protein